LLLELVFFLGRARFSDESDVLKGQSCS
jgi:hypothetical protein